MATEIDMFGNTVQVDFSSFDEAAVQGAQPAKEATDHDRDKAIYVLTDAIANAT